MKNKILEIIDNNVKEFSKYKDIPFAIIGQLIKSASEIADMVQEFMEWKHYCTATHNGMSWYVLREHDDKPFTFDELFTYWFENIKDN